VIELTLVLKDFVEFKDLDAKVQEKLLNKVKSDLLTDISGSSLDEVRIMCGDEVADAVEKAWNDAEDMQTPWFFCKYLMDHEVVRNFIDEEAMQSVKSYYWHKEDHTKILKEYVEIAA
jgi:hypothetical protein